MRATTAPVRTSGTGESTRRRDADAASRGCGRRVVVSGINMAG
jgi:hypothetical protein